MAYLVPPPAQKKKMKYYSLNACTTTIAGQSVGINCAVDCSTRHVVYLITCTKCKKQFVGHTQRSLAEAYLEHINIVNNRITNQPTGRHFTLPGNVNEVLYFQHGVSELFYANNQGKQMIARTGVFIYTCEICLFTFLLHIRHLFYV